MPQQAERALKAGRLRIPRAGLNGPKCLHHLLRRQGQGVGLLVLDLIIGCGVGLLSLSIMILSLSGCGAGILSIRRRIGSALPFALGSGNLRGPGVGISGDGDGVITPLNGRRGRRAAATSGLPALSESKAFSKGGLSLRCIA